LTASPAPPALSAHRAAAAALAQLSVQVVVRHLERRRDADQEAGRQGGAGGEQQHRAVERHLVQAR
jgi:hypothetical protein